MFKIAIVHYPVSKIRLDNVLYTPRYPMSILTRKRRRSEAFQEEAEEQQEGHRGADDGSDNGGDDGEGSMLGIGDVSDERTKKEREVWDAFREEQYESRSSNCFACEDKVDQIISSRAAAPLAPSFIRVDTGAGPAGTTWVNSIHKFPGILTCFDREQGKSCSYASRLHFGQEEASRS